MDGAKKEFGQVLTCKNKNIANNAYN